MITGRNTRLGEGAQTVKAVFALVCIGFGSGTVSQGCRSQNTAGNAAAGSFNLNVNIVVCRVSVKGQQLHGAGGIQRNTNAVGFVSIHDLLHGFVHRFYQIDRTVVILHTAGNVQNIHNVNRNGYDLFLKLLIGLSKGRQCHTKGIRGIAVKCTIGIIAVDDRLIRQHLTVIFLMCLECGQRGSQFRFRCVIGRIRQDPEFLLNVGGGGIGIVTADNGYITVGNSGSIHAYLHLAGIHKGQIAVGIRYAAVRCISAARCSLWITWNVQAHIYLLEDQHIPGLVTDRGAGLKLPTIIIKFIGGPS